MPYNMNEIDGRGVEVFKQFPQVSYSDEKPTCSRQAKMNSMSDTSATGIVPIHLRDNRSSSCSSVRNKSGLHLDQQEKVSVRLVENQGLVVDPDDDEEDSFSERRSSIGRKGRRVRDTRNHGRRYTVGTDFRISPPNSSSSKTPPMISSTLPGGDPMRRLTSESDLVENLPNLHLPFTRTRYGSNSGSNPVGVSSLIPLMDGLKESHKIEVVIKPPPSMIKTYNGSNIHLCCALVFVFSASIFSSLTLLLAKVLKNRDHHPISIAFWRYLGMLVPSVPITIFYILRGKKQKILGSVWPIHDMNNAANALALLMKGVLGSTAIILRYCSLDYLTIANTSVISYCAPVFAAVIAPLCLKKFKAGFIPIAIGVFTSLAVFALTQPPFLYEVGWNDDILKGVFISTLSMFCSAFVLISVYYLLERVHFSLMLLVLGLWGTFEAGVLAWSLEVLKVPQLLPDILMMFGVALLSFFSQLFLLLAMRMGHIGSVSVMKSCDILMSFLWQYLFLKTKADTFEILSAVIIILCVWLVCYRKWLSSLGSNNFIRNRFAFLLR